MSARDKWENYKEHEDKLEPCKYCGGTARVAGTEFNGKIFYGVFCETPKCINNTSEYLSRKRAIEEWNRKQRGEKKKYSTMEDVLEVWTRWEREAGQ